MPFSPNALQVISELCVNLAAGWFATAIIIPIAKQKTGPADPIKLAFNFGLGILFVVVAIAIRNFS